MDGLVGWLFVCREIEESVFNMKWFDYEGQCLTPQNGAVAAVLVF